MIKNKHLTYINTGKTPQVISVEFKDKSGTLHKTTLVLKPGEIVNDSKVLTKVGLNIGSKIEFVNINTVGSDGAVKSIIPEALNSPEEILKKSRILDIETTELRPGAPITQIAITDLNTRRSNLFIPAPNLVGTPSSIEQGMSFLNRIKAESITLPEGTNFRDLVFLKKYLDKEGVQLTELADKYTIGGKPTLKSALQASKVQRGILEDLMIETDFFQAKLFVEDEQKLLDTGRIKPEELEAFGAKRSFINKMVEGTLGEDDVMDFLKKSQGLLNLSEEMSSLVLDQGRPLRDIIANDMPDLLRGGVTWIANTGFESGQFGAQIKAEANRSRAALNEERALKGLPAIDEADFMRRFNLGEFQEQLSDYNARNPDANLYTKNPFADVTGADYRTGKPFEIFSQGEFSRVRAEALKSGDFSLVYDALIKDTRVGDVRDIQDLSRSLQSKLSKIGILDIDRPTALSVEVQGRLAMAAREMRLMEEAGEEFNLQKVFEALKTKETHIAVGDTVLSESPLLRESFDMLEALRQFEQGGEKADALLKQASQGKGALFRAFAIGGLQDYFNKTSATYGQGLDDVLFKQMAGRAFKDIADQGYTEFRRDKPGLGAKRVVEEVKEGLTSSRPVASARYHYERVQSMEEVFMELERVTQYKHTNKKEFLNNLRNQVQDFFDIQGNLIKGKEKDLINVAQGYIESHGEQIKVIESRIGAGASGVDANFFEAVKNFAGRTDASEVVRLQEGVKPLETVKPAPSSIVPDALKSQQGTLSYTENVRHAGPPTVSAVGSAAENMDSKLITKELPGLRRVVGKGFALAAGIGGLFAVLDSVQTKQKSENYLLPDYDQFLDAQSEYYGSSNAYIQAMQRKYGTNIEGLQEQGLMSILRSKFTDFGSPYQGMGYSTSVLNDYQLRRERQKYEQAQFGSRHFSVDGDVGFQLKRFVDSIFRKQMGFSVQKPPVFFGNYSRIDSSKYNSLKGDNLIEYKFNPADIDISDADTITVKRQGAANNPLSSFMGTGQQESMSFRLAGIDAPETAHGDRAAQPYAEAAKRIATDLIRKAKEVRIVSRPDDRTYGRQVGMVYVDGKNLNLELVKRGAAAYLPYKGKGKSQFYNQKSFEDAQKFAQKSKRGMWRSAYFQAYQAITEKSGQTVTFNTLVNVEKVAKNSSLMSMYSLMNQADRMGFINNSLAQELTTLGQQQAQAASKSKQNIFSPDEIYNSWMGPELSAYGQNENSINTVLDQLKYETTSMYKTRGSKTNSEIMKSGRVRNNNLSLSKDALSSARESWNSEKVSRLNDIQSVKATKYRRMKAMEELQQTALGNMFNSPIGHTRM